MMGVLSDIVSAVEKCTMLRVYYYMNEVNHSQDWTFRTCYNVLKTWCIIVLNLSETYHIDRLNFVYNNIIIMAHKTTVYSQTI